MAFLLAAGAPAAWGQITQFGDLFKDPVFLSVEGRPVDVKAQDLNGDGRADFVVASKGRTAAFITLYRSAAGGFTRLQLTHPTLLDPRQIALDDLDLDGRPDLVIANGTEENVLTFLGDANGGFDALNPIISDVPGGVQIRALDTDLIDADAVPDAVTGNLFPNGLAFLRGLGDGAFETPDFFSAGFSPTTVRIADFNHNGLPDAAMTIDDKLPLTPTSATWADVSGDGQDDLSVALAPEDPTALSGVIAIFQNRECEDATAIGERVHR